MSDRPNRGDLLAVAERTLRDEVLPALDGGAKYAALMVVSALATARREIEAGDAPARVILDAFADLYGQDNVHRSGDGAETRIDTLTRDLARDIREGAYDGDLLGPVHRMLLVAVAERLRLSNPGFADQRAFSQPSRD